MRSTRSISPFTDVSNGLGLRQAMGQLLDESVVGSPFPMLWAGTGAGGATVSALPLDVYAIDQEAVVVAAVPGLSPDDLSVTFQDGTLVLSGEIKPVLEGENAKDAAWYLHELWSGRFQRAVSLPFAVDPDRVEATWEHGIVRIVLPKAERAKPKTIPIGLGSANQAISTGAATQSSEQH